jgi:hypothetical protein
MISTTATNIPEREKAKASSIIINHESIDIKRPTEES